MWLSENAARRGGFEGAHARVGRVTIGGRDPAVLLSGEHRGLGLLCPGGMGWLPEAGEQVMVLETDDGEKFILGAAAQRDGLAEGTLTLRCGSAALTLCRDGRVDIQGALFLNGAPLPAVPIL